VHPASRTSSGHTAAPTLKNSSMRRPVDARYLSALDRLLQNPEQL
jgi:hypothetical protein